MPTKSWVIVKIDSSLSKVLPGQQGELVKEELKNFHTAIGVSGSLRVTHIYGGGYTGSKVLLVCREKPDGSLGNESWVVKYAPREALIEEIRNFQKVQPLLKGSKRYCAELIKPKQTLAYLAKDPNTLGAIAYETVAQQVLADTFSLDSCFKQYIEDHSTATEFELSAVLNLKAVLKVWLENSTHERVPFADYYEQRWAPHYFAKANVIQDRTPFKTLLRSIRLSPDYIFQQLTPAPLPADLIRNANSAELVSDNSDETRTDFFASALYFQGKRGTTARLQRITPEGMPLIVDVNIEDIADKIKGVTQAQEIAVGFHPAETRYGYYKKRIETYLSDLDVRDDLFIHESHVLLNPLRYLGCDKLRELRNKGPYGIVHGDLHAGNILVGRAEAIIIDFALAAEQAPMGVDQGYLVGTTFLNVIAPRLGNLDSFLTILKAYANRNLASIQLSHPRIATLLSKISPEIDEASPEAWLQHLAHLYAFAWIAMKWSGETETFYKHAIFLASVAASAVHGWPPAPPLPRPPTPPSSQPPPPHHPLAGATETPPPPPHFPSTSHSTQNETVDALLQSLSAQKQRLISIQPGDFIPRSIDCTPNFLLFRRGQELILVISESSVNAHTLQRTNATKVTAQLLSAAELAELHLQHDRIGPFDPALAGIKKVIIDSSIYCEAAIFPQSFLVLPVYSEHDCVKIVTPIGTAINLLFKHFGQNVIFYADTSTRRRYPKRLKDNLLTRPVITRFAPSPTGGLHLGNVRTALIAYLWYLKSRNHAGSKFFLRHDDTDKGRSHPRLTEKIAAELRWLGLSWTAKDEFKQTERHSQGIYKNVLDSLQFVGAITPAPDGAKELEIKENYNELGSIYFDWRLGPVTAHGPQTRFDGAKRHIQLARPGNDLPPFYRFAGIIDDIERASYVFRDCSQLDLTSIQARIRAAIEACFRDLPQTQFTYLHEALQSGVREWVKLPVYVHVQQMVDEVGNKLSKRDENGLTLGHLKNNLRMPAEAIVSYVLSTFSCFEKDYKACSKQRLTRICQVVASKGVEAALVYYANFLDLDLIVDSGKPIRFRHNDLKYAELQILRQWQEWRLVSYLRNHFQDSDAVSNKTIKSIWRHRSFLANCRDIIALIVKEDKRVSVPAFCGPEIRKLAGLLTRVGKDTPDAIPTIRAAYELWIVEMNTMAESMRAAAAKTAAAAMAATTNIRLKPKDGKPSLPPVEKTPDPRAMVLTATRQLLTGHSSGPPLLIILEILGEKETLKRLNIIL